MALGKDTGRDDNCNVCAVHDYGFDKANKSSWKSVVHYIAHKKRLNSVLKSAMPMPFALAGDICTISCHNYDIPFCG